MKIAALADFFINPSHFSKPDTLWRARLFVRACLLTSLFSTTYIWLSMFFGYDKGVYLMGFNVIGFLLLPFLGRTKWPVSWLGNLYVFIGAFAIIVLTYYSGGVWSAIYPWIISIPVLALLVVNRLSGGIWGAISFLFMLWFAALAYLEIELPVEYNYEMRTLWYISVLPGLLLIILFIAFVFESIQSKAMTSLAEKNQLLESQKETIAAQSSELERLIEEKDYIIRILAHDIRNPLQNITSLVGMMENDGDSIHKSDYIRLINQSSSSAQNLVNRVLEMDTLDQKADLEWEQLNICLFLAEIVETMSESAVKKQIQINLHYETTQCFVLADKTYLHLVFENLLSNAIKFSEPNKQVHVVISNDTSHVKVKIIDEGPGINPEEEDRLFQKFSKLSSRPTAGESSTGLGLSLVKRYVELVGGEVWYEASSGPGASFVVELALAEVEISSR